MESGLQELKFSRYNQKVELSGKLFETVINSV